MRDTLVGLIIIELIAIISMFIYFIIGKIISKKKIEKTALSGKKKEETGIGIHVLFTKRDLILRDIEHTKKQDINKISEVKFNKLLSFSFFIFTIGYIFIMYYYRNTFVDVNNLRYLFSASAQTIGAIFGISISMLLIFTQSYAKKYHKQVIRNIFLDTKLMYVLFFDIFTVVLCLLNLVSISEPIGLYMHIFYIFTLFLVILCLVSIFYVLARFFIIINPENMLRGLEKRLRKSIEKGDVNNVESIVNSLAQIIDTSIIDKDRDILKEGIDVIHDFIKYYIINYEDIFKKIESQVRIGGGMHNFSDWLLDEILSHYTTFFMKLIDEHQYNSASYLIRALSSCGVESLNYPNENAKSMISKTYRNILNYSLKLDQDSFNKISMGFNNFIEYTLLLEGGECYITLKELFEQQFLIDVLRKKPGAMVSIASPLYNSIKYITEKSPLNRGKKETLPWLVRLFATTINTSNYLIKHREFSYLIKELNKKLQSYLTDICILMGIFCFHNGWKELAWKCKEGYAKVINEKQVFKKIERNLKDSDDDIKNLTINHKIHHIFSEYKSDSEPLFFDKKKFVKSYKGYKKLNKQSF